MNSKDFEKFLKSKNVNSYYLNHYKNTSSDFMQEQTYLFHPMDVFNKLLKERIIILSGEMDEISCEMYKANLLYLESLDSKKDIKLYISSGGGSVYSGLGVLDTMEYIKPDVITINTGLAASMAAVILCSGSKGKRKSLKRSRTMIHQPMAFGGYLQASDIEIDAKEINSLKRDLLQIISEKTSQKYDKVEKDSDRDYWMTAEEALKYGMIDEIITKK